MIEINAENLKFAQDCLVTRLENQAENVTIEKADYNEIREINHQLSKEFEQMRQEDAEAEAHAWEIFSD